LAAGSIRIIKGKTPAARREIPIHPELMPLLNELASPKYEYILDEERKDKDGGRGARLGKAFMHLKRSLGHPDTKTLHSMRHSVAALLYAEGVQEITVSAVLGQKPRGVTAHYLKSGITMELKRAAIEKLDY